MLIGLFDIRHKNVVGHMRVKKLNKGDMDKVIGSIPTLKKSRDSCTKIGNLPKVFALLSSIYDFLTGQMLHDFLRRGAHFAKDIFIFFSNDLG